MEIGVAGIGGRMGRLVAEAAVAAGAILAPAEDWTGCAAVIDFTHPDLIAGHAKRLSEASVAWILGTTGLTPAQQDLVDEAASHIPVVQAANFSAGVTLLLDIARRLGQALPASSYDAEILDVHHRQKIDSPSGTALALGQAVAAGRGVPMQVRAAAGPRHEGAIGFAALRGGQVVGEHTLVFAGETEHITLGHKALDRRMFAQGAVRAAFWVQGRPPGLYGMTDVMGVSHTP